MLSVLPWSESNYRGAGCITCAVETRYFEAFHLPFRSDNVGKVVLPFGLVHCHHSKCTLKCSEKAPFRCCCSSMAAVCHSASTTIHRGNGSLGKGLPLGRNLAKHRCQECLNQGPLDKYWWFPRPWDKHLSVHNPIKYSRFTNVTQ